MLFSFVHIVRTADYSADFSDYADYENQGNQGKSLKSAIQTFTEASFPDGYFQLL